MGLAKGSGRLATPVADIGFHFPLAQNFWPTGQKIPPPRRAHLKYWAETIPPPARAPLPPPKSATGQHSLSGLATFSSSPIPRGKVLEFLWLPLTLPATLSGGGADGEGPGRVGGVPESTALPRVLQPRLRRLRGHHQLRLHRQVCVAEWLARRTSWVRNTGATLAFLPA